MEGNIAARHAFLVRIMRLVDVPCNIFGQRKVKEGFKE